MASSVKHIGNTRAIYQMLHPTHVMTYIILIYVALQAHISYNIRYHVILRNVSGYYYVTCSKFSKYP